MADNTTLNTGTGGDTLRDKDRAGVKTPIVAIDLNPAGAETLMAGAMPVTGTFWQTTQPVSTASLPLPTGASTAAKQPALGVAGTAATDVITVQGITAMTALKVDGSGVTQPVSGTFWQATQPVSGTVTVVQATAANLNATVVGTGTFAVQASQTGTWSVRVQDGAGNALTSVAAGAQRSITVAVIDASGNQITSFGGSGGTASNFGSVDPATGTAVGFSDGTNMREARVFDADSGAGAQYVLGAVLRKSASGGSVEAGTSTDPLRTDPTGTTTQPVSGTVTANLGTLNGIALDTSVNGILVAQGSTTSGQKGSLVLGAVTTAAPSYTTAQTSSLSLDTSGNLRVLAAPSGTYTVSGTVTSNQGGTWTVQPGNTANTTAWLVTGTGGTFPATQSGTWNVGTITTVTTVSAVTAITNALPAGTNLLGKVSQGSDTSTIYNGTTALTPKFAAITASASGATTIVAAVTAKKLRILRWSLSSNGTVNVNWQSHTTTATATGLHYLTQFASAGGAYCSVGIFETVAGEALDLNLSAAVAVGGELTYIEV